jgi:hypothetical protein
MATFSYFYTVSADTDYEEYFDTAEQGSLTQEDWLMYDDLRESVHNEVRPTGGTGNVNGVYTGPKSEVAPYATTIKVKKQMKVIYYLRFYMKEVDGSTTKYYWLNDSALKNVTVTAASSKFYKYSGVSTVKPGNKGFVKSRYPGVLGVTSGHCFVFTMYVKEANFKLNSGFTVTAKFTPSDFEYSNTTPNPSSTEVTITNAMIAGLNPGINCTQAAVNPTPNKNFIDALQDITGTSGFYTQPTGSALTGTDKDVTVVQTVYAYDSCTKDDSKRWIGVKWGKTISADRKKILVKYVVFYGSKSGQGFDATKFKPKTEEVTKGTGRITSPSLEKILDTIIAARVGNCAPAASGGSGGADDGDKPAVITRPVPPLDKLRWNPPPHIEARSVNFAYRLGNSPLYKLTGNASDEALRNELFYSYSQDLKAKRFERGKIFQDKITAKVMNNVKGLSVIPKKADVLQWGYQFMYNPETIRYQTTDGSGIDWTYGSKDKATVISGSQNISFDLLINRIPDMNYWAALNGAANGPVPYASPQVAPASAYGRPLEDVEIQGIMKRGTEYDIEFLYRVLTGDPITNSPLLEPGYAKTALTSDIGYITKVPVWLYLHDNMRFFGYVSSIDVTHRIFDQNMIPTLTRMTVAFTRYPAFPGEAPITTSTPTTTGN